MILNVPKPMPDELLFNYIYRVAAANGIDRKIFINEFVLESPGKKHSLPYGMGIYITKFADAINANAAELFLNTTLYPLKSIFISRFKQVHIINAVFRGRKKYPNLITYINADNTLRMCPCCAKEEKQKYGFAWYHRAHSIPTIKVCHKHHVPLYEYIGEIGQELKMREEDYRAVSVSNLEVETDVAEYAYELLYSGISCEWANILQNNFLSLNNDETTQKYTEMINVVFNDRLSFSAWRKKLNASGIRNYGFYLRSLYIMQPNIKRITYDNNTSIIKEFLKQSIGYKYLKPVNANIAVLQKDNEPPFVTTPYGFTIGWRSPYSDDNISEQERYKELLKNIKQGEYEPISEFQRLGRKVSVVHKVCGSVYNVIPKNILELGSDCPCLQTVSLKNIQEQYAALPFTIHSIEKYNHQVYLNIRCHRCGESFRIGNRQWVNEQYCRICERKLINVPECKKRYKNYIHLNDTYVSIEKNDGSNLAVPVQSLIVENRYRFKDLLSSHSERPVVTYALDKTIFELEMYALVGDEYELVDGFVNLVKAVTIRHCICGQTFRCTPSRFLQGGRCTCRRVATGHKFEQFVAAYTYDEIHAKAHPEKQSTFIVENRKSKTVTVMKKQLILQELLRPTESHILPVSSKNRDVSPYVVMKTDTIKRYLKENIRPGEVIDCTIEIPGVTNKYISFYFRSPRKNHIVKRISETKYIYLGER